MSFPDVIDLSSDDEGGEAEVEVRNVKQEPGLLPITNQDKGNEMYNRVQQQRSDIYSVRQVFQGNGSCGHLNTTGNNFRIPDERISAANGLNFASKLPLADQGTSAANGLSVASKSSPVDQRTATSNGSCFASKLPPAPITRQFWKAGEYDDTQAPKVSLQSGQNHLRVHPKFLHSNATSHKWAFGAIAELLDNAFDEIGKGASFVMVDKASNPRDGRPLLLIQDDGGGMDPESMRRCMSFGFSDKKSKSAIGQYGNGFKTSTMRLGADVIVFSRHAQKREFTQSVGLLSYTFLRQTGHDRIVVPMVDYEFDASIGKLRALSSYSAEHFSSNISMLLQWSPYGTEAELLKQFDDIGRHGTKVLIYNLWYNDDGDLELDFESDAEDILISGAPKIAQTSQQSKMLSQQHVANRFQYSLRVYSSILYLRVPKPFRIILRGRVVEHHNLADDLKFPEFILYKPHVGGNTEGQVVTTIGFLKDAPHVNIHGFSVYHKNRLIMPFWRVVSQTNSRGRGVAGVLEANFIEPTHNKQEFEKTSLFLKLESRLKDMTLEYWDYHCILIGYNQVKKASASVPHSKVNSGLEPVKMNPSPPVVNSPRVVSAGGVFHDSASARSSGRPRESPATYQTSSQSGLAIKRKAQDYAGETAQLKRQAGSVANVAGTSRNTSESQSANGTQNQLQNPEAASLMQENKKLQAQCLEYEKIEEELSLKVEQLKIELIEVQHEYARLQAESKSVDTVKEEET